MTLARLLRAAPGEGPVRLRRRLQREGADLVLAPLAGGAGAFVDSSGLISLLEAPGAPVNLLRRLLERVQARRSRLLVATDRAVAIACVRRWDLDLSRIRLVPDFDRGLEARLAIELRGQITGRTAWHSAR